MSHPLVPIGHPLRLVNHGVIARAVNSRQSPTISVLTYAARKVLLSADNACRRCGPMRM